MPLDSAKYLRGAKIEIPEDRYMCDLNLHDRYQSISAEFTRLALSGIAVVGVFLSLLSGSDALENSKVVLNDGLFSGSVIATVIVLSFSAALALLHRYLGSDGLYHHIRAIKALILWDKPTLNPHIHIGAPEQLEIHEQATEDEKMRNRKFTISAYCLFLSGGCLVAGASALSFAFVRLLIDAR